MSSFIPVALLLLASCSCERTETATETDVEDECTLTSLCDGAVTVQADSTREPPEPVSIIEGVVSIAVGNLAGTGTPQVYVGTNTTVTRLDGDDWATATDIWTSNSGDIHPLIAELTGDGVLDLALAIPKSDDGAGQVVVFPGPVTEPLNWGIEHFELKGSTGSRTGEAISTADLDADGQVDLLVDEWVRFGPIDADLPFSADTDARWLSGEDSVPLGGGAAGDVDGDGLDDLVFLAARPSTEDECWLMGLELHVFPGPLSAGSFTMDDAPLTIPLPSDTFTIIESWLDGRQVQVQDLDFDGVSEIIVGVLDLESPNLYAPAALVYAEPLTAESQPTERFALVGHLAAFGDIDGDGYSDLLQADLAASWFLGSIGGVESGPTLLRGPLDEGSGLDPETCDYPVAEAWSMSPATAAWTGDLDQDGVNDVVLASSDGVRLVLSGE